MRMRNMTCKRSGLVVRPAAKRERESARLDRSKFGPEVVELKRTKVSSIALGWIVAVSLTASPLLAEYPPQSPSGEAQAQQREALSGEAQARQREALSDA